MYLFNAISDNIDKDDEEIMNLQRQIAETKEKNRKIQEMRKEKRTEAIEKEKMKKKTQRYLGKGTKKS